MRWFYSKIILGYESKNMYRVDVTTELYFCYPEEYDVIAKNKNAKY